MVKGLAPRLKVMESIVTLAESVGDVFVDVLKVQCHRGISGATSPIQFVPEFQSELTFPSQVASTGRAGGAGTHWISCAGAVNVTTCAALSAMNATRERPPHPDRRTGWSRA